MKHLIVALVLWSSSVFAQNLIVGPGPDPVRDRGSHRIPGTAPANGVIDKQKAHKAEANKLREQLRLIQVNSNLSADERKAAKAKLLEDAMAALKAGPVGTNELQKAQAIAQAADQDEFIPAQKARKLVFEAARLDPRFAPTVAQLDAIPNTVTNKMAWKLRVEHLMFAGMYSNADAFAKAALKSYADTKTLLPLDKALPKRGPGSFAWTDPFANDNEGRAMIDRRFADDVQGKVNRLLKGLRLKPAPEQKAVAEQCVETLASALEDRRCPDWVVRDWKLDILKFEVMAGAPPASVLSRAQDLWLEAKSDPKCGRLEIEKFRKAAAEFDARYTEAVAIINDPKLPKFERNSFFWEQRGYVQDALDFGQYDEALKRAQEFKKAYEVFISKTPK